MYVSIVTQILWLGIIPISEFDVHIPLYSWSRDNDGAQKKYVSFRDIVNSLETMPGVNCAVFGCVEERRELEYLNFQHQRMMSIYPGVRHGCRN